MPGLPSPGRAARSPASWRTPSAGARRLSRSIFRSSSRLSPASAGVRRASRSARPAIPGSSPSPGVFYSTLVQLAERERLRVLVSTSSRSKADEIRELVGGADVQIVDPGREVVLERIRERYGGVIPPECEKAIERWYGDT